MFTKHSADIADSHQASRAARPDDRLDDRPEVKTSIQEGLWCIQDVSLYLRVSISSIYKMTAPKSVLRIPCIRIGSKLRFRRSDIDRWLALRTMSNLETLETVRRKVLKVTNGNNSQKEASEW